MEASIRSMQAPTERLSHVIHSCRSLHSLYDDHTSLCCRVMGSVGAVAAREGGTEPESIYPAYMCVFPAETLGWRASAAPP